MTRAKFRTPIEFRRKSIAYRELNLALQSNTVAGRTKANNLIFQLARASSGIEPLDSVYTISILFRLIVLHSSSSTLLVFRIHLQLFSFAIYHSLFISLSKSILISPFLLWLSFLVSNTHSSSIHLSASMSVLFLHLSVHLSFFISPCLNSLLPPQVLYPLPPRLPFIISYLSVHLPFFINPSLHSYFYLSLFIYLLSSSLHLPRSSPLPLSLFASISHSLPLPPPPPHIFRSFSFSFLSLYLNLLLFVSLSLPHFVSSYVLHGHVCWSLFFFCPLYWPL